MQKSITAVVGVVLVVAGFFAGQAVNKNSVKSNRSSALSVGQTFVANGIAGDLDTSYNKQGSTKLREGVTIAELTDSFGKLKGATTAKEAGSVYVGETSALYLQPVTGLPKSDTGSEQGMVNLILEKEDGNWKVLSATLQ